MSPAADDRLTGLEERVRVLEAALTDDPVGRRAEPERTAVHDPDRFWALEGLRSRPTPEGGAVLFTGIAHTPDGAAYEWQEGRLVTDLLDSDWEEAGTALAALANPVRMLLLQEILRGRTSAAELTALDALGTSGQVYHHLRQLTAAGWLRTQARGRYTVPPERVIPLLVLAAAVRR